MQITIDLIKDPMFKGQFALYMRCPKFETVLHCGLTNSKTPLNNYNVRCLMNNIGVELNKVITEKDFETLT